MRKLMMFNSVTLNGFFSGPDGDFSWAHRSDDEWDAFVAGNANGGSTLVFGRVTYDLMASYWPTPVAAKNDPIVAERMNNLPKIVFSRTLDFSRSSDRAAWQNTTLIEGDIVAETKKLKNGRGSDMVILGSGSIVAQLAEAGLIDELQVVMVPVVLGSGKTLFGGVKKQLNLKLTNTRTFRNGNVVSSYQPA